MRTEIASLGEFGLIDRLTEGIKLENESSKYGVGDDAAVLSYPSEKQVLVTTDLLMEGVHFDLTYVSPCPSFPERFYLLIDIFN